MVLFQVSLKVCLTLICKFQLSFSPKILTFSGKFNSLGWFHFLEQIFQRALFELFEWISTHTCWQKCSIGFQDWAQLYSYVPSLISRRQTRHFCMRHEHWVLHQISRLQFCFPLCKSDLEFFIITVNFVLHYCMLSSLSSSFLIFWFGNFQPSRGVQNAPWFPWSLFISLQLNKTL